MVPEHLVSDTEEYRSLTPDHLAWLERRLGPYPLPPLRRAGRRHRPAGGTGDPVARRTAGRPAGRPGRRRTQPRP
ncbi:hypothetical protein LT493_01770 [Streptomyces tricolor]|nr:hypothetical protein [Streptomyces tricolor]